MGPDQLSFSGYMHHREFHPWASRIGAVEKEVEQIREVRRAVESLPAIITGAQERYRHEQAAAHDKLRGEMFAALAETDKRFAALIERMQQESKQRNQLNVILGGIGFLLAFLSAFLARQDPAAFADAVHAAATTAAVTRDAMQ